jgi:hypothetical protein
LELAFGERGQVILATFSCEGEPESLKDGRGWFRKSRHLAWRCGWELQAQCSITVPKERYGWPSPQNTREYNLGDQDHHVVVWDVGNLVISDRLLSARFAVPDCLRLQRGRAIFSWSQPIFLGKQMFHCSLLLRAIGPKDGSYLQLREATPERAGGFDFMSASDQILDRVCNSEKPTGRGRCERVLAMRDERGITGPLAQMTRKRALEILAAGGDISSFRRWIEVDPRLVKFDAYIDTHPSSC